MRSVVLDTNLLCLLVIGRVAEDKIERHKRLNIYTKADYRRLIAVIATFDKLIVCPHVLAECSNLIRQTSDPLRSLAGASLRVMVALIDEEYLPARTAMDIKGYDRLGLTDAVLLGLTNADRVLLSDDLDLYLAAMARGAAAVNYSHLREGATLIGLGFGPRRGS